MAFFNILQRICKTLEEEFKFYVKDDKFDIPELGYTTVYHDSPNPGESFLSVTGYTSKDAMERYQAKRGQGDHAITCTSITKGTADFSKTIHDEVYAGVLEAELIELFREHVLLLRNAT